MRSQKAELIGAIVPVPSCAVSENADCNVAHSKMTPTRILLKRAFSTPQAALRIWVFTGLTNSIRDSVLGICARQASAAYLKFVLHKRRIRSHELQIESGTRIVALLVPITFRSS